MDYQAREILILKDDEFLLMLAASGIEQWYGIDLNETNREPETEREFNYNLASLYRKQIIEWSDEKAHIAEPYRSMFKVLKAAKACIIARKPGRQGFAEGGYFCGDDAIIVGRRTGTDDEIELSAMPVAEWIGDLADREFFPETAGVPEDETVSEPQYEAISEFELHDIPEGDLMETMKIYEHGLYGIIQLSSESMVRREYFSMERAAELLAGWIGGEA